jgi:V8-like Glu-specific endopeptidase
MGREASTSPVAAYAAHLLPELDVVAERLESDPADVLRRAFSHRDEQRRGRAIVGPMAGLEPLPVDAAAVSAERTRLLDAGIKALDALRTEGPAAVLTADAQLGIEAIVSVARPALLLQDGSFGDPPPPWDDILAPYRQAVTSASASVGRIDVTGLSGAPYAGTGFLVGADVVMTNCHVARLFSTSGERGEWSLRSGMQPSLQLVEDPDARVTDDDPGAAARIEAVIGVHPGLDLALLRITPSEGSDGATPLTLMSESPGSLMGRTVYLLGYPAPDPRNNPALQRSVFGDRFFVKRVQPGALMAPPLGAIIRMEPCSSRAEPDDVVFHDASTLGGNSGSCVVDLETNRVIGLHFAGEYMHYNEAVALWRLVDDPLLTGAGVNFG